MKNLKKPLKGSFLLLGAGILISLLAFFICFRLARHNDVMESFSQLNLSWILIISSINFIVIFFKAIRWQILITPVQKIGLWLVYQILVVSYMISNVFPAKLGELARIHLIGRQEASNMVTSTGLLIADHLMDGLSFIVIAFLCALFIPMPGWLYQGIFITFALVILLYSLSIYFCHRSFSRSLLQKFQVGIRPLLCWRLTLKSLFLSFMSWFFQFLLLYLVHVAFSVNLPLWSMMLILIATNISIVIPSGPAHLGTFELACVMVYSYLGVDESLGFALGLTYHILQIIPVTLVGGIIPLVRFSGRHNFFTKGSLKNIVYTQDHSNYGDQKGLP